jgi:Fe-S oxidoreductase
MTLTNNVENQFTCVISTLNSKFIHSSLAPWYLLAGVREFCGDDISATVIEGTINDDIAAVCARIVAAKPNAVGFGCYIWNIAQTKALAAMIKSALPEAAVIFGGPEVSYNQAEVLRDNPAVDFVLSGEGEEVLPRLLRAISSGSAVGDTLRRIGGVSFRGADGEIVAAEPYISCNPPPNPYSDEYFAALNGRIAYIETSRGCPYSCAFCLSGRCGGVRFFDIERSKSDIVKLANSGTKTVKFVDRTFNANRKRAHEILAFIIESYKKSIPDHVCFHFEIAGDILDDATIALLQTAPRGLMQMEIGLQSFNEKTLESVNRKTDTQKLSRNIRRLTEAGNIHIHIDLIAGLPFEDYASFERSFNTAYALRPHMLQLGFLKLIHGSDMREDGEKYTCEYAQTPPYEVISTPWISHGELDKIRAAEDALERMYNSGRFANTLAYIEECAGADGMFGIFEKFGAYVSETTSPKKTLDEYSLLIFDYFSSMTSKIDRGVLRDMMAVDRLSTNSTGKLPQFLKTDGKDIKKVLHALNQNPETASRNGVKRAVTPLLSHRMGAGYAYVDYDKKDAVTGKYNIRFTNGEKN